MVKKSDFKVNLKNDTPATIKEKWVGALRSKLWWRGMGELRTANDPGFLPSYCCLGVLKNISGLPTRNREFLCKKASFAVDKFGNNVFDETTQPMLLPAPVQTALAKLNDSGKTFPEIADYIEQNVKITKAGLKDIL